VGFDNW
jgi:hypothetical protein